VSKLGRIAVVVCAVTPDSLQDMRIIAQRSAEPPLFEPAVPGWPAQAN
jgi:hypothetical protein